MNAEIEAAIETLEAVGVTILSFEYGGKVYNLDGGPNVDAPPRNPLAPRQFDEITEAAVAAGVMGGIGDYTVPTRFFVPGVSAQMDAQIRENLRRKNAAIMLSQLMGGDPFCSVHIYDEDGTAELVPGAAIYTHNALRGLDTYFEEFSEQKLIDATMAVISEKVRLIESHSPGTHPELPLVPRF